MPEDLSLEMINTEMIHAYFMLHTHTFSHTYNTQLQFIQAGFQISRHVTNFIHLHSK